MSWLGTYELTHPELLSEHQLHEILKNSCIEIVNFEKLYKNELLEIYKRVAMPLPQRQRDNAKSSNIEIRMVAEESVTATSDNTTHNSTRDLNRAIKRPLYLSHSQTDRLKSINGEISMHKKIRLSSLKEVTCNGNKHKYEEQLEELLTRKRQKITWP